MLIFAKRGEGGWNRYQRTENVYKNVVLKSTISAKKCVSLKSAISAFFKCAFFKSLLLERFKQLFPLCKSASQYLSQNIYVCTPVKQKKMRLQRSYLPNGERWNRCQRTENVYKCVAITYTQLQKKVCTDIFVIKIAYLNVIM